MRVYLLHVINGLVACIECCFAAIPKLNVS